MKQDIIAEIAETNLLRTIINNVAKNSKDEDLKDLEQDLYLELLEKDEELIEYLYENDQLNFFLTKMVTNNINSKTSRFYYNYKKHKANQISIDEYKETADSQN